MICPPSETANPEAFRSLECWSFFDMMRFYAASFLAAVTRLHHIVTTIDLRTWEVTQDRQDFMAALEGLRPELKRLPLSSTVAFQLERLISYVPHRPQKELAALAAELSNSLIHEMTSQYFLVIPAPARPFYEQPKEAPFGNAVSDAFPAATQDISAASRCVALEEWNACVFHLMGVLEHGLQKLGAIVGLLPEETGNDNWKNVIDRIEKKIREMEGLPKSPEKIETLRQLSDAAAQFRYFKDAWRNHVAHARIWYDARDGWRIWTHVRMFMQQMAAVSLPSA